MQLVRKGPLVMPEVAGDQDAPETFLDDRHLVEHAKRDPPAFALLYERYHHAIYVYCFRRLGTPESSDDATSIVFMKAFSALSRFCPDNIRSGSTFRSWLFSIARNVVIDARRRDRRHSSLDASHGELLPSSLLVDSTSSPEDAAIGAEEARTVMALLDQLPERPRAAVELRLAGLSTSEVANVLGMSISATKSLQFRAYRTLRDLLRSNPQAITREIPR